MRCLFLLSAMESGCNPPLDATAVGMTEAFPATNRLVPGMVLSHQHGTVRIALNHGDLVHP